MCDHVRVAAGSGTTTGVYPEEARRRLGRFVEASRVAATPQLSQRAVGGDTVTYARIRDGLPVRWATVRRAMQALGVSVQAAVDVLEGRPACEDKADSRSGAPEWDALAYLTAAGELIGGLAGNTPEEQAQVMELLERGRRRLRERRDGRDDDNI